VRDLVTAADEGVVKVTIGVSAKCGGSPVMAVVTNCSGDALGLEIRRGTVLVPRAQRRGRLVVDRVTGVTTARGDVSTADAIVLDRGATKGLCLAVLSLDFEGGSPSSHATFRLGAVDQQAEAVLEAAAKAELSSAATQAALWLHVTEVGREDIEDRLSLSAEALQAASELEVTPGALPDGSEGSEAPALSVQDAGDWSGPAGDTSGPPDTEAEAAAGDPSAEEPGTASSAGTPTARAGPPPNEETTLVSPPAAELPEEPTASEALVEGTEGGEATATVALGDVAGPSTPEAPVQEGTPVAPQPTSPPGPEASAPAAAVFDLDAYDGHPWPGPGGPYGLGLSPFRGPRNPVVKWKLDVGGRVIGDAAVASDGTVYVRQQAGKKAAIVAVTAEGQVKWKAPIRARVRDVGGPPPCLGADGTVYAMVGGDLYALSPAGEVRWQTKSGGTVLPAFGPDGTLYLPLYDERCLCALTPDGEVKWKVPLDTGRGGTCRAFVGPDGTIYVGTDGQRLYAIAPDGEIKWNRRAEHYMALGVAVGPDGTVYAASAASGGALCAWSPEGERMWKAELGGTPKVRPPRFGPDGTPYVGPSLRGGPGRQIIVTLDEEGRREKEVFSYRFWKDLWGDARSSPGTLGPPLIDAAGVLYVVARPDYQGVMSAILRRAHNAPVFAVRPGEEIVWSMEIVEPEGEGGASIGADGTLYVPSGDWLYAIGEEQDAVVSQR
jgi:outer membrane protein assembly factor BamB